MATFSCKQAGLELRRAARRGDVEAAGRTLLDEPDAISTVDSEGRTALHHACADGCVDVVQVLLDGRADINAFTDTGATPLDVAMYWILKNATDDDKANTRLCHRVAVCIKERGGINHEEHSTNGDKKETWRKLRRDALEALKARKLQGRGRADRACSRTSARGSQLQPRSSKRTKSETSQTSQPPELSLIQKPWHVPRPPQTPQRPPAEKEPAVLLEARRRESSTSHVSGTADKCRSNSRRSRQGDMRFPREDLDHKRYAEVVAATCDVRMWWVQFGNLSKPLLAVRCSDMSTSCFPKAARWCQEMVGLTDVDSEIDMESKSGKNDLVKKAIENLRASDATLCNSQWTLTTAAGFRAIAWGSNGRSGKEELKMAARLGLALTAMVANRIPIRPGSGLLSSLMSMAARAPKYVIVEPKAQQRSREAERAPPARTQRSKEKGRRATGGADRNRDKARPEPGYRPRSGSCASRSSSESQALDRGDNVRSREQSGSPSIVRATFRGISVTDRESVAGFIELARQFFATEGGAPKSTTVKEEPVEQESQCTSTNADAVAETSDRFPTLQPFQQDVLRMWGGDMRAIDPARSNEAHTRTVMAQWQYLLRRVSVRDLRFSHGDVSPTYLHGWHRGLPLETLFDDLCAGRVWASQLPALVVVQYESRRGDLDERNLWCICGNRRLTQLYKYQDHMDLVQPGTVIKVPCLVHDISARTTPQNLVAKFVLSMNTFDGNFPCIRKRRPSGSGSTAATPVARRRSRSPRRAASSGGRAPPRANGGDTQKFPLHST